MGEAQTCSLLIFVALRFNVRIILTLKPFRCNCQCQVLVRILNQIGNGTKIKLATTMEGCYIWWWPAIPIPHPVSHPKSQSQLLDQSFQMAKYNIETRYSVVGLVEHFDTSLAVMEQYLPGKGKRRSKTATTGCLLLITV